MPEAVAAEKLLFTEAASNFRATVREKRNRKDLTLHDVRTVGIGSELNPSRKIKSNVNSFCHPAEKIEYFVAIRLFVDYLRKGTLRSTLQSAFSADQKSHRRDR